MRRFFAGTPPACFTWNMRFFASSTIGMFHVEHDLPVQENTAVKNDGREAAKEAGPERPLFF